MAVIDLSTSPAHFLREPLLIHIAEVIAELSSRQAAATVVVLFPAALPSSISLFWTPLTNQAQRVDLLALGAAKYRVLGDMRRRRPDTIFAEYTRRIRAMATREEENVSLRLVRRLGHFSTGADECSRYYFEGSLAVAPMTRLIFSRFSEWGLRGSGNVLAVPEQISGWMLESVTTAAMDSGFGAVWRVPARSRVPQSMRDKTIMVCTDVVRTGGTIRSLIERLTVAGLRVHPTAIAAVVSDELDLSGLPVRIDSFHSADLQQYPRESCPQCKIDLGFTPLDESQDRLLTLRSFDFWDMMVNVSWSREGYGPSRKRLRQTPAFAEVFERYGDFIALVLSRVVAHLELGSEIAFVCPYEPAMEEWQKHLEGRFGGRSVMVSIPRKMIGRSVDRVPYAANEWRRQLEQLARNKKPAVILDEFSETGGTARGIYRMLRSQGVQVAAYVPMLNRHPGGAIDGSLRTLALYEIPAGGE